MLASRLICTDFAACKTCLFQSPDSAPPRIIHPLIWIQALAKLCTPDSVLCLAAFRLCHRYGFNEGINNHLTASQSTFYTHVSQFALSRAPLSLLHCSIFLQS